MNWLKKLYRLFSPKQDKTNVIDLTKTFSYMVAIDFARNGRFVFRIAWGWNGDTYIRCVDGTFIKYTPDGNIEYIPTEADKMACDWQVKGEK